MPVQNSPLTPLRVYSLASGSSGNVMLVQYGETNLLIDAGLTLKRISPFLAKHGVAKLDAVLLTHEHTDHASGAGAVCRKTRAPLVANAATLQAYAERDSIFCPMQELSTEDDIAFGSLRVRSFPILHDAAAPAGYILTAGETRIAYCTDVGSVTREVREAFRGVSLAIIEANHDLLWLKNGPYTPDMKARVASDTGHLSNDDCASLMLETLEETGPCTIWLAHLSRVNNSPSLARRTVRDRLLAQTKVPFTLEIALRDHPSVCWQKGRKAVQLSLL